LKDPDKTGLGPQHAGSGEQKQGAQNAAQPQRGNAGCEMRTDQAAGDRTNQQRDHERGIDVAQPEVEEAGDSRKYDRVHNVGSDVDLGRETVEEQKQHHDNAAGTHRSHPDEKARDQADQRHSGEPLHRRRAIDDSFLDPPLEEQQNGNDDQQHAHRGLDEVVDSVAVEVADVHQQLDAANGARDAADGESEHHLTLHRAALQMHDAGWNLGEEVEEGIGTDGYNRRHTQAKDQDRQQQNPAADTAQADQYAYDKSNQDFSRQQFHNEFRAPCCLTLSLLTPSLRLRR
jgi:hypothetical protein